LIYFNYNFWHFFGGQLIITRVDYAPLIWSLVLLIVVIFFQFIIVWLWFFILYFLMNLFFRSILLSFGFPGSVCNYFWWLFLCIYYILTGDGLSSTWCLHFKVIVILFILCYFVYLYLIFYLILIIVGTQLALLISKFKIITLFFLLVHFNLILLLQILFF